MQGEGGSVSTCLLSILFIRIVSVLHGEHLGKLVKSELREHQHWPHPPKENHLESFGVFPQTFPPLFYSVHSGDRWELP